VEEIATQLGLDATGVKADALWLAFVQGAWRPAVRSFAKSASSYVEDMQEGRFPAETNALPPALLPVPPPGVVSVPFGAMRRITSFVRRVKSAPGYQAGLGELLGIIGSEDAAAHPVPEFSLELAVGTERAGVNIYFTKFGHYAVVIESRSGPEALWESLAICARGPFLDERPLRVPGQPEMREYRLRFWDRGVANGEWSGVSRLAVGA
jgi:hypothetical protein